jgi:hypothetical protein
MDAGVVTTMSRCLYLVIRQGVKQLQFVAKDKYYSQYQRLELFRAYDNLLTKLHLSRRMIMVNRRSATWQIFESLIQSRCDYSKPITSVVAPQHSSASPSQH